MNKRGKGRRLKRVTGVLLTLVFLVSSVVAPVPASGAINEKALANYTLSYLGNNYPGIGGNEEPGLWVQHDIDNAYFVNGTILTASNWDEAGRCTGLYRDGEVNNQKVRPPENNKPPGWAWGTGSYAVAGNENHFWIFNDANHILHFEWDYTNIESARFIGHVGVGTGNRNPASANGVENEDEPDAPGSGGTPEGSEKTSFYGREMTRLTGYSNIDNNKIRGLENGSSATLANVACENYTGLTIESETNMGRDLHIKVYLDNTDGEPIAVANGWSPNKIENGHRFWTIPFNQTINGTHDFIFVADLQNAYNEDFLKFSFWGTTVSALGDITDIGNGTVMSLSEKDNTLYALRNTGWIEVRDGLNPGTKYREFSVANAKALAVNPNADEVWVIVGNQIRSFTTKGKAIGRIITVPGNPINLSFDEQHGHLVVCDGGPRQQIYFYDVSGTETPTLVKSFGQEGGLSAGIPGEDEPDKFNGLKAAGTDKDGNIYVVMSFGTAVMRKLRPDGVMVWERAAYNFTDCTTFMPGTDGTVIYGVDEIFEVDYSKGEGKEATVTGITANISQRDKYVAYSNAWVCELQGKRVLFLSNMYNATINDSAGFDAFVFDDDETMNARFVGSIEGFYPYNWAYDIDSDGTIWVGEETNNQIKAYKFQGFNSNGKPLYNVGSPIFYNRPGSWTKIERIIYDEDTDIMYLSGFTSSHPENTWGCVGHVMRAYKWNNGNAQQQWEMVLPSEDEGGGNMLPPKSIAIAGDYIFAVTSRGARVHVFNKHNCNYVGTMNASPYGFGWVDIPYALKATKRENGEYVVLVEDDWRSKNILYRWTPNGSDGARFNQDDVNKMKTFLNSNGNLSKLEGWDINEPASWKGVSWKEVNGERRLSEIILANKKVTNAASLADTNATLLVYPENGENVSLLKSSDGSKTLTIKTAGYGYVCGEITNSGEVNLETKTPAGFLKY